MLSQESLESVIVTPTDILHKACEQLGLVHGHVDETLATAEYRWTPKVWQIPEVRSISGNEKGYSPIGLTRSCSSDSEIIRNETVMGWRASCICETRRTDDVAVVDAVASCRVRRRRV